MAEHHLESPNAMVIDSDEKAKVAEEITNHEKDQFWSDLKNLMAQQQFRRFLRHLARWCSARSTVFSQSSSEMARREGKRQLWIELENLLAECDEDLYITMLREHRAEEKEKTQE